MACLFQITSTFLWMMFDIFNFITCDFGRLNYEDKFVRELGHTASQGYTIYNGRRGIDAYYCASMAVTSISDSEAIYNGIRASASAAEVKSSGTIRASAVDDAILGTVH